MNRKFRVRALSVVAASMLFGATTFTAPTPARAQAPPPPTPHQCALSKTTPEAWDTSTYKTRPFSCVTVEVETRALLSSSCAPGTSCWPIFQIRARRINVPGFIMARAQATPGPTCVLEPTSTAWTAWATCNRGASGSIAPSNLNLFGAWL